MASCNREKSIVRFDEHVSYIDRKLPLASHSTLTSSKLLGTQTSSLNGSRVRLSHQYLPRLHRQTTEIPSVTPLSSALHHLSQTSLVHEYSMSDRSSALEEFKTILDKVTPSLSRNLLGLRFSPAVYSLGFSHWQIQPERRVVCYLPVRLPNTEINHKTSEKVFIQLPHRFPASINIEPPTIGSDHPGCQHSLSANKLYSLVRRMLKRLLVMKSVATERLHFPSYRPLLEVALQENEGWVGEIVVCVVAGSFESNVLYCCKPFHRDTPDVISPDARKAEIKPTEQNISHCEEYFTSSSSVDDVDSTLLNSLDSVQFEGENHNERCTRFHGDLVPEDIYTETDNTGKHNSSRQLTITQSTTALEDSADVSWYPCNPHSENSVVRTVSKTDGGVRMTAMMIVCKMAQHDWRLTPLRCHHVQTAMYHDAEHHLDYSPRWQRNSLQRCVQSLLSTLHRFTRQADGLPHFSISGIDLWSNWTPKQRALANSALGRLVSSQTAMVSLVCRTGNINFEHI